MDAKRILVTGGSGFVGSSILTSFIEQHPQVDLSVLDIQPLGPEYLEKSDIRYFHADITKEDEVLKAVKAARPDVVVHTAGYVPTINHRYNQKERNSAFQINVTGTQNVLAASKKYGVRYFVFTSSFASITDDTSSDHPNMTETVSFGPARLVYGESKAIAERAVLDANSLRMLTCAIRPSPLYGVGDYNLIPTIHNCIAKGETPFIIGTGLNLYDFSFVSNIADAHVLAVENLLGPGTAAGEAFFVSNGQPVPFRAFCLAVWAHFDHYPPFEFLIPKTLARVAGFCSEVGTWITGKPTTLSRGSVGDACHTAYASIDKAREILGYEPRVSLIDSLRASCLDYKRRLENEKNAIGS